MSVALAARPAPPFADLQPSEIFLAAPWAPRMQQTLDEVRQGLNGELFIYISDPWRGYRFGYRAEEPAYLASGVKIAFMLEVFRQREQGRLNFDEQITYDESDLRDGAPRVNKLRRGAKISIGTLLDWMMRSSDNAASDMLARRVGLAEVKAGLTSEGIPGFHALTFLLDVRRGVYRELDILADDLSPLAVRKIRWTQIWEPQLRALERALGQPSGTFSKQMLWDAYERFYDTGVNSAPMASVGLLLEKLCRGELVSRQASLDMLELMSAARTSRHRLLGKLPRGTRVAHKTGSQFRRLCDLGIITLRDGHPLVVAACIKSPDVNGSEAAFAALARAAYDLALEDHQLQ